MNATRNIVDDRAADLRCRAQDPHPEYKIAVQVSRFWRLVNVVSPESCWLWKGDTDRDSYGVFLWGGKVRPAHELALSFTTGEKRHPDLETRHSCDTPPCCNPNHLQFGTRQENVNDMLERGRGATPGRKLTDDQVVTIRERRSMGARQKDLAEQFGVTDGQISMIVRGERWKHLGGPIEEKRNRYRKAK